MAYVLANSGVKQISIFDIEKNKAEDICAMVKDLFPGILIEAVESVEKLNIRGKDLLINATPVGLKETDPCLVTSGMMHKEMFVYDLIYSPEETKLLALAKKSGAKTANGLLMLLYQGMLAFKIWTGTDAPQEIMLEALKKGLKDAR